VVVDGMVFICFSLFLIEKVNIIISFVQAIYTYIPETNGVTREYSGAAIL
jgi:hypothetical protein